MLFPLDYSGANLSGMSFAGRSLRYANFSTANLFAADFTNADLEGANFSGANLSKANLKGARVTGARFDGANLRDAIFPEPQTQSDPLTTPHAMTPLPDRFAAGFVYDLNPWNAKEAPPSSWRQEMLRDDSGARSRIGWHWHWPAMASPKYSVVYSYPEAIFGRKPWDSPAVASTTDLLPKTAGGLRECTIDYDVELTATSGVFNLAPELWFVNQSVGYTKANITTEIMIWMDYADDGGYLPSNTLEGRIQVAGRYYDVFTQTIGNGPRWKYVAFRVVKPQPGRGVWKARLPLFEFIHYCIAHQHVDPNHWLCSIEFGTEILSGAGTLWINDLDVFVR